MRYLLGACGLDCSKCEAYIATQENNLAKVEEIVKQWSAEYGGNFTSESIWCDGCMSDTDRKCGHCAQCDIRNCVTSRKLSNCSECMDYECERISKFMDNVPGCRERLNSLGK